MTAREFFRELHRAGLLPVSEGQLRDVVARLEEIIARVAAKYHEELAPAIERVGRELGAPKLERPTRLVTSPRGRFGPAVSSVWATCSARPVLLVNCSESRDYR